MNNESDTAAEVARGYIHPQAIVDDAKIGEATRVWAFAHVMPGASVGKGCNIGEGCFVERLPIVGHRRAGDPLRLTGDDLDQTKER